MRRPLAGLVLAPALALVGLAACAPYHAGAAAAVGNQRITTSQLREVTMREISLANKVGGTPQQGASAPDQTSVQQTALTEMIQLKILRAMASDLGVTVTATDIGRTTQQIKAQNGGDATAGKAALKGFDLQLYSEVQAFEQKVLAAIPVDDSQIAQAFAKQTDHRQVRLSEVDLGDPQTAQAFATAAAADPTSFAALARQVTGADPVPPAYYPLTQITQVAGSTPIKAGAVIGPLQSSASGGYVVLQVLSTRVETLADALAPGSDERAALQQAAFPARYAAVEKRLGVHVSPRFGAWNQSADGGLGTVGDLPVSKQLSRPVGLAASPSASPSGQ
ncbi:MAG TPA: SurA N-terminal domain-containing protein [Mycobacteriales bacterium]